MAIGDIKPQEDKVIEVVVPQVVAALISADVPDAKGEQTPAANQQSGSATHKSGSAALPLTAAASPTLIQG